MKYATSNIIAASQLFACALGAPLFNNARAARSLVERASYTVFGGDGSAASGWPKESDWKSFDDLWSSSEAMISSSCTQFGQENNSEQETADIKSAITSVADETKIPAAFLLAIMMQESKGCVRAPTTNYGYDNPGLMQSFQGTNSCNPSGSGTVPCPAETIKGMISDGAGVGREAGLTQSLAGATATDDAKFFQAARIYNSGSVSASGNLGEGVATHCYCSDIANRLLGWDGESSGCSEGSIASVTGSAGSTGNAETTETPETTEETTTPTTTNETPATTSNTPTTGGESEPSGPKAQGASASCTKWYTVKSGDVCSSTGIDINKLVELNSSLKSDCSNLWLGSAYCVAA